MNASPKVFLLLFFSALFLAFSLAAPSPAAPAVRQAHLRDLSPPSAEIASGEERRGGAETFLRAEIYFGMSRPGGGEVTEEEFAAFLGEVVTPRFPAGLSVISGVGQFRDARRRVVREKSKVLILLYPARERRTSGRKIKEICRIYKRRFEQESVLRVDDPRPVRVSF